MGTKYERVSSEERAVIMIEHNRGRVRSRMIKDVLVKEIWV